MALRRRFSWLTWTTLRSLGNSQSVKLSALFPFVGFWILFNDQAHQFLKISVLDGDLSSKSWIESLWLNKIFFVYFGLLFLGIGSFIYQARCPYIIKKHADWSDYVTGDGEAMNAAQLFNLSKVLDIDVDQAGGSLDKARSFLMQNWYADQSADKPFSRLITASCFFIGLGLLAVPSIISAIKVGELFVGKIQ